MSFFSRRKSYYLHFSFLFAFLGGWLFSYVFPVCKAFLEDDHMFYGTVSHASIPSIFGGTDIPFFDKTMFRINGDDDATFVLYASKEILDDMSEWFSFAAKNAGDIPLEISAARMDGNKFIVHSLASSDGELTVDDLVIDYQVYYGFLYAAAIALLWIFALVLFCLWLFKKRR
ncbi:MAG: hypothetical protein HUK19_09710 [Fibrobacter sp.]|nr:hypothetical protein [Fibrobacter sp.]